MSKRKLSKQQRLRIKQKQQERIERSERQTDSDDSFLGPERPGMVTARYSKHADIKPLDEAHSETIKCHIRANIQSITVGDKVVFRDTENQQGVVVAVEDRQSLIQRADGYGKLKPIAANIDQVFIVIAIEPEFHPNLIDRYLVAARNANIEAHLVLNKIDIRPPSEALLDLLAGYQSLGYDIHLCSCESGEGVEEIRAQLANKTSIFAGQSGVGKSSLLNVILPEIQARVGALSEHVTKGRHTTTTSELFELPEGGYLIDSPGIREFHLSHFTREDIYKGFKEFDDVLGHCQFRDCKHLQEPGCVVNELIEDHGISDSRLQSLDYILSNLDA